MTLLALSVFVPSRVGADWTVQPAPSDPGGANRCRWNSDRQPMFDGYQTTWAQIVVDDKAVRVTSASTLDGSIVAAGEGDRDAARRARQIGALLLQDRLSRR
ncbi:MAG: hypothetical protein ACREKS_06375 [Candidatus Rokuibacteriota bacterium]